MIWGRQDVQGPRRTPVDRDLRHGAGILQGRGGRGGRHPVGNPIPGAQRPPDRTGAAAARREAVPRGHADPAPIGAGAGALHGRVQRGSGAGPGGQGALRMHHGGRSHRRRHAACARIAGDHRQRGAAVHGFERTPGRPRAAAARSGADRKGQGGGEEDPGRQGNDRAFRCRHRSCDRHRGSAERRGVGLLRPAQDRRPLAGRHRRRLPAGEFGERHAGARRRRREPDLQALPAGPGDPDHRERLRHRDRGARAPMPSCSGATWRPGTTGTPTASPMWAGA